MARSSGASSGGWRWRGSRPRRKYLDLLLRDARRTRSTCQGFADQCHGLLSGPRRFRFSGQERHSRSRARSPAGPAAANLGRRLQFRRRDLFPRHAVSRADRRTRSATSNCKFSRATSTRTRSRALARASIPHSIEADVSPERLAEFFIKEDRFYRISAELRSMRRLHGA